MPNRLYNILVPVDFTPKNKWAIAKAIELANSFNCNIHLVYINSKTFPSMVPVEAIHKMEKPELHEIARSREKLIALKNNFKEHICGKGRIEISLLSGNKQQQLVKYIEQFQIDLVITGLSKYNILHRIWSSISISHFSRKTNIPVLAIRASGLVSHFKKIVLPLSDHIPIRRIRLAAMLGRHFKSTIYVVLLKNDKQENNLPILNQTLEVIQSLTTIPVQHFILEGKNMAKSTLDFSKRINADLIMINPMKDFCLPGLWNKVSGKLFSNNTNIPIITISNPGEE